MNIRCKNIHFLFLVLVIQAIGIIGEEETQVVAEENLESLPSDQPAETKNEITEVDPEAFSEFKETDLLSNATSSEVSSQEKSNVTITDASVTNFTKVNCLIDKTYGPVEIVNYTRLMELLILDIGTPNRTRNSKEDKQLPGACILVMFYARWCVFSSQAAPHFNAIPRFYPHLKVVAIDAMKYQNFNTQYGIVGVPTLMLVHNAKPVAKFNATVYNLETFSKFLSQFTNLQPNDSLYVTSADFSGPVSSTPSNETDYCLVLSWVFIAACLLYFTTKSHWWRQFIELVQNTWRESNAQHEHAD
ncbi:thioredoxin domain-containing protein 15 [Nasonia vitripennis]|uniref:Thioredoxin domain-containing protein n=1 Tax=Nasonia vitripennis TaxID=7425 RepID=A0A7M7G2U3_NASVI|nr:thioredoxin domain-containing protein 15 [Nasonia vitripennis]